jgi:hypothetical protein
MRLHNLEDLEEPGMAQHCTCMYREVGTPIRYKGVQVQEVLWSLAPSVFITHFFNDAAGLACQVQQTLGSLHTGEL